MTDNEHVLFDNIRVYRRGPRNAASASTLAARFRTTDRAVRAMIRNLRLSGTPICGTPVDGFYFPTTREEGRHTLANLASQEQAVGEVRAAFEDGLDAEFGPERLFEGVMSDEG